MRCRSFRMVGCAAFAVIAAEAAASLANGQFLAYNRESGGTAAGMLEPGWPPGRFIRIRELPRD